MVDSGKNSTPMLPNGSEITFRRVGVFHRQANLEMKRRCID